MPQDSRHPDYEAFHDQWTKCRHALEGEESVKMAGTAYLPQLSGQDPEEYDAYKMRASFFGATSRTVEGLVGAVLRKAPKIEYPDGQEELLDLLGEEGESIYELIATTLGEVIGVGRFGLLVDAPAGGDGSRPYVTTYFTENIINWQKTVVGDREVTTRVVLEEKMERDNPEDPYEKECVTVQRELYLDLSGERPVYTVVVWEKVSEKDKDTGKKVDTWVRVLGPITPRARGGRTLDFIPFAFINKDGTGVCPSRPPMIDLVNVNLSHYRTSADLEHGRHFTALPTVWVAGFDLKTTKLMVGSPVAWVTKNTEAKAGMLEFTGAGLGSLADALKHKESQMAVLGARLLEEQKREAETAETLKIRQSGDSSVLSKIAGACSEAWTKVLRWVALWSGKPDAEVSVKLNQEFTVFDLKPDMLANLMAAVQSGAISWDTFFFNCKRAEMYPPDWDEDMEREKIQVGNPMPQPPQEEDEEDPDGDEEDISGEDEETEQED